MKLDDSRPEQELDRPEVYVVPTLPRSIQSSSNSGIIEENVVLRKLLRKWRYFDYRDGISFKKAHSVNSPAQMLGSPCYVCGQFTHTGKRCPKRRICSTCKRRGHIAVDCPENNNECIICLRCGGSGHELFSCSVEYCSDDLKNIQCYVCNEVGHIFCGNYTDISPATASCYNCGESGHSGLECPKPHLDMCGLRPPSICYKCGGDHAARRCSKEQGSELNSVVETNGNGKTARRSKAYRHGRLKKKKISGVLEVVTV